MKLVELLARELDVWPEVVVYICQDGEPEGRRIVGFNVKPNVGSYWSSPRGRVWDMSSEDKSSDYKTAIITRADWQAERERIAGGWISHDGGECPVTRGTKVDIRYREGREVKNCGALTYESDSIYCARDWGHNGSHRDIIAYRLHKPEQASAEAIDTGIAAADAGQVKPIQEVKAMYEYNPIHTRDRINEIDRTTKALEEERASLVQRLADEGFVLARADGKVAPAEDMSDWRNWKAGDSVEVISDDDDESGHKKGAILKINEVEKQNYSGNLPVECSPEGPYGEWPDIANIRWHSRPTA